MLKNVLAIASAMILVFALLLSILTLNRWEPTRRLLHWAFKLP